MRAFIAIDIPAPARAAAGEYQDAWRTLWPTGSVTWTRAEGFHLTLRFLGEIEDWQAVAIGERLAGLARKAAIPATFPGPLGFPDLRRPRILALATDAPPGMWQLADDLDRALDGLRLGPRDKPFRPHLTLGRVRDQAVAVPGAPPFPEPISWEASRIALFRSHLGPHGSRYEELHAIDLRG